jgi:alkaline phosphatase D
MKKLNAILFVAVSLLAVFTAKYTQAQQHDSVYFTTGFKVGEVTDNSAIIWTRLCSTNQSIPVWHERKEAPFRSPLNFDNNMPVDSMDGAVNGAFGQVKIALYSTTDTILTDWIYVSEYKDFTIKKSISNLHSNTVYKLTIWGRKNLESPVAEIQGAFKTAPAMNEIVPVTFTSTSCQYYWDFDDSIRGFKAYDSMRKLKPDFHCQTGDFVYYDKPGPMAYNVELARHKWHAMDAWPSLVDFYANVPVYLQKDDHDALKDDASPKISPLGELSFNDGVNIWQEQAPIEGKPYRTMRWGKDLQIWLVEGREYRNENNEADGPDKSIWGKEQKEWFMETMQQSDATFKILLAPTPVVGPDRVKGKNDNHANAAYKTEGDWLRAFLGHQKNAYVINGDRHWQYESVDSKTGLREFSQGPTSDSHAQGWKQEDLRPEHKFLRVNGGFVGVNVYRIKNKPEIKFTFYNVDGDLMYQEVLKALE